MGPDVTPAQFDDLLALLHEAKQANYQVTDPIAVCPSSEDAQMLIDKLQVMKRNGWRSSAL